MYQCSAGRTAGDPPPGPGRGMPAAVYQGSTGFGLYCGSTKVGMHHNPANRDEGEQTMHHGSTSPRVDHGSTKLRTHHDPARRLKVEERYVSVWIGSLDRDSVGR